MIILGAKSPVAPGYFLHWYPGNAAKLAYHRATPTMYVVLSRAIWTTYALYWQKRTKFALCRLNAMQQNIVSMLDTCHVFRKLKLTSAKLSL